MTLQASMLTLLQAVRIALLFGHVGVSGLDLGRIFKATYSRGHRPDVNVTSITMTCPVSRTLHCERLCTMTSGCMSFYYNPLLGTCQFYSDAARCPADKNHRKRSKLTDLYFYRREGGQKAQPRRWTRLLYGPIWSKGGPKFFELSLHRKKLKTYPYLRNASKITCITLLPKSRRLLVSMMEPVGIWNVPLDRTGHWKLVINAPAKHMAVDEDQGLLIFIDYFGGFLRKLYLECPRLEDVIKRRCRELAVFANHQLICTCVSERLMVVSYYGSTKRIVAVGDDVRLASNAAPADVLYFYASGYLRQISLTHNAFVNITALEKCPRGIISGGQNKVYLFFRERAILLTVSQTIIIGMKTIIVETNFIYVFLLL